MIEPPLGAPLVTAIGSASLAQPRMPLTSEATVALAAVTAGAQKELAAAFTVPTNPPSEAIVRRRHALRQAALDNGSSFVAG
jgi:predicted RNA polymerase sigma factor